MNKTTIIFLLGTAGSGKDSVGEILKDQNFKRIAFGDAAKEEFANEVNIPIEWLHIQGEKKEEYRKGLIEYAEAERDKDPLVWINKAFEPYVENKQFLQGLRLVVTDVRRESEIKFIHDLKERIFLANSMDDSQKHYLEIKLIKINRPDVYDKDILTHNAIGFANGLHHIAPFSFIDAIINNNSDLKSLTAKVTNCIKHL